MKNLFVILSFLISVTCFTTHSWGLPPCPKSGTKHNCYGLIDAGKLGKYEGEIRNNKANGQGAFTYADEGKYLGEYKDNKKHGQGTHTWANGDKYIGEWKDDKMHGQGTYTHTNGKIENGEWKNDKLNGFVKVTHANGTIQEGIWKDDKFMYAKKNQKIEKKYAEVSKPNTSSSASKLVAEKHKENEWVVDYVAETSIHASVNGIITHGDRLQVRLVKGNCDVGNLLTSVYTMSNHPDIIDLKNKYVKNKFMDNKITAKIQFTLPFLLGHVSTVNIGWIPIDELKNILLRKNEITMEYFNSEETEITEYFDVTKNIWSNVGLSEVLIKVQTMCKNL